MNVINVLDTQTANLIAAGEVVDRPAAVAKELLENAIDAGSTKITVEIKNGGSTLIRVTDNGKGMSRDDVRTCVLRHATSKIKVPKDLEGIVTLGFRGEALAAISSVSRFQIISKEHDTDFGVCMSLEGEKEVSFDEVGCPDGTTVTVRDIFFNVPARRKFLKKDATETAYISQYVERIAISHPEIAIKFIADTRVRFSTNGNGDLYDTIYSVFGREFVESLMKVERKNEKVSVTGFVSLPEKSRINRNHQILFVNNRFVRSRIISFAVEDAFKSYIMTERYPAFILFVDIDPYLVDINVHPTKLEVRFVDDSSVREAVYFAVKNQLESILNPIKQDYFDKVQENLEKATIKNAFVPIGRIDAPEQQEIQVKNEFSVSSQKQKNDFPSADVFSSSVDAFRFRQATPIQDDAPVVITFANRDEKNPVLDSAKSYMGTVSKKEIEPIFSNDVKLTEESAISEKKEDLVSVSKFIKYRGIVFNTYIIAEYENNMYIIDKHAAHERIIYESMKRETRQFSIQSLLETHVINVSAEQFECAMDNIEELNDCGFEIESFGKNTLALRGIPSEFSHFDISHCETILVGLIDDLISGKSSRITKKELFDRSLYTAACKAATKAGFPDDEKSYVWLINKLFDCENVFCCPHGRPIIVKYTKSQIEKMFFRT
ncbi:MAG: DNA mismatch repair endonuclease MutL [Ruminococcaceae bacterium]|nr:DNA mismatch repair endonuclease MutL [Oscillospiraceae bacterium]